MKFVKCIKKKGKAVISFKKKVKLKVNKLNNRLYLLILALSKKIKPNKIKYNFLIQKVSNYIVLNN